MRIIGIAAAAAALLCSGTESAAAPPAPGAEYEIVTTYQTSGQTSEGSSSSSRGGSALVERVVAVRPDGLELEYDLPRDATPEDRMRSWRLPARVFKAPGRPMELLNAPVLEARLEAWLKAGDFTREACGRWLFTWAAFKIECDPLSILEELEAVDLRSINAREGALYRPDFARAPGRLARKADGTLVGIMVVDPDAVRLARAKSDVVVGEIMRKPVTLEAALDERAREQVSGTIEVTLETNGAGDVRRLTRVTRLETRRPDGQSETESRTETIERRLVSNAPGEG